MTRHISEVMREALIKVRNDIGMRAAIEIIYNIGGVEKMADIPDDRMQMVIDEARALIADPYRVIQAINPASTEMWLEYMRKHRAILTSDRKEPVPPSPPPPTVTQEYHLKTVRDASEYQARLLMEIQRYRLALGLSPNTDGLSVQQAARPVGKNPALAAGYDKATAISGDPYQHAAREIFFKEIGVAASDALQPGERLRVTVEDGKYTVIQKEDGGTYALRYGEEWRDCVGDGLILALAVVIHELREKLSDMNLESREER